jgi:plasmid maintenance system antidote protein VapI
MRNHSSAVEICSPIEWISTAALISAGQVVLQATAMTTIRSRELGDALRSAMEDANLSGRHAAHVLGWSETKVSRMLTGRQPVTDTDVASLLALCMVKGEEKERLLKLAREHDQAGC